MLYIMHIIIMHITVSVHLELRNVFQTVFFVSKWEHSIFLEGVDWYHILLHRQGKVRCRFNVLCALGRPTMIYRSFCDNVTAILQTECCYLAVTDSLVDSSDSSIFRSVLEPINMLQVILCTSLLSQSLAVWWY